MTGLAYRKTVNAAFLLFLLFSVANFAEYTICDESMEKMLDYNLPETFEISSFVIIPKEHLEILVQKESFVLHIHIL